MNDEITATLEIGQGITATEQILGDFSIPTKLSDLEDDAEHRTVTDLATNLTLYKTNFVIEEIMKL